MSDQGIENLSKSEFSPNGNRVSEPDVRLEKRISWTESFPSTESFVSLLRNELKSDQWKLIIGTGQSEKIPADLDFERALKLSIENGIINPDLGKLCDILTSAEREDLVGKIQEHSSAFVEMDETEFHSKLMEELEPQVIEEHEVWDKKLRHCTKKQNKKVSITFDDDENVLLESVFTNLTVLSVENATIDILEMNSINEITFLRTMSQKETTLETIDFIKYLTTEEPVEPEIICLIGNSGCGKTFLCKYIALLYGTYKLMKFRYVLSIKCNNEDWHTMEKAREEKEEKVGSHFLRKFLSICMPLIDSWSETLSKYLVKADGEGLLLILDGVDEFTKCVPFKSTLLYTLLQRRMLTRAAILITSRPGQWNKLKEEHGEQLKVDSNFQVLGFSPSDRDIYFKKRISTEDKLRDTKQLFFRHDEINQLSLIPVNASLFTSLFNATVNILSQTLTDLYTKLIIYIIRRQLSRMGLKKLTKVSHFSEFHPSVLECIDFIGEEAYEGIFHRELSSREEDVSIQIDESQYLTERLGLMEVQVKELNLGQRVNVWTYAHLTLQEYMAAVYLSNKSWVEQCVIIRYIVSSEEVFVMYRMVVRFLCGILAERAACLIPIICCNLTPDTMPLIGLPISHQLCFDCGITSVSNWVEFTKFYLICAAIIVETNSKQMKKYFSCFKDLLPEHLNFFFINSVSPNEWHSFVLSLKFIRKLEILAIKTSLINPTQLSMLLNQLSFCSLTYLSLFFCQQDYETIQLYTNLLSSTGVSIKYKINIGIDTCDLLETKPSTPLFTTQSKFTGSLRLKESQISNEILDHLTKQFSLLENMFYAPKSGGSEWSILKHIISHNSQIKCLCIRDPNSYLPLTPDILSDLSSLQELSWHAKDAYSTLSHLSTYTNLSYLSLSSPHDTPPKEYDSNQLIKLIANNSTSLRSIELHDLETVGLNSWTSILTLIQSCCNLVSLSLSHSPFTSDDISYWNTAIQYFQSLIVLSINEIPLQDSGLMILCKSLNRHPAIRNLKIDKCSISYISCKPIEMLIPTLPYLKELTLNKPELTRVDPGPLQILGQTAEHFLVKVQFTE